LIHFYRRAQESATYRSLKVAPIPRDVKSA
jgi:hypothetical protein